MEDYDSTRGTLEAILRKLNSPAGREEDLLQDALLHYLRMEARFPSNTHSWKITSCKYELQRRIRQLRLREAREVAQAPPVEESGAEVEPSPETRDPAADVVARVCGREEMSRLMAALKPLDQTILRCIQNGLRDCEISVQIHLSHQAVIAHRRKIESTAVRIGILEAIA